MENPPGYPGLYFQQWSTLGTRYIVERCRHDIRVLRSRKSPSHEFLVAMLQFSIKLSETTLMRSTLGTRYLRGRCRCHIRVQQPQKPPSSPTGLISINIYRCLLGIQF
ncbi:hypothetical protein TSAR_015759 [Trichomalopsis sarcophagae]|uniref:Uncharacterized protein n=1 Tax=Trichomalopsis sarcophagae TaxID=543379 RepID=A0A232F0V4_9HYME|nr:hypothetical protein TSAR_015759 [Trichomalopsis sarcophagae]